MLDDDDVKIPNVLWVIMAILVSLGAAMVGRETAESRKQIEAQKTLEYHDASTKTHYHSDEYEEFLKFKEYLELNEKSEKK